MRPGSSMTTIRGTKEKRKPRQTGPDFGIICVKNNEKIYNKFLGATVNKLAGSYKHLAVNNIGNKSFTSAAAALNHGANKIGYCKYYIFVHADVMFKDKFWLSKTKTICDNIDDLGVAGCAGVTLAGKFRGRLTNGWLSRQKLPAEEVMTLDELIMIVPYDVFDRLKFDSKTFNSWHSYGSDYSLAVTDLGLKAYAIKNPVYHDSPGYSIKTGTLNREQDKLKKKWKHKFNHIRTTCGKLFAITSHPMKRIPPVRPASRRSASLRIPRRKGLRRSGFNKSRFAGYKKKKHEPRKKKTGDIAPRARVKLTKKNTR